MSARIWLHVCTHTLEHFNEHLIGRRFSKQISSRLCSLLTDSLNLGLFVSDYFVVCLPLLKLLLFSCWTDIFSGFVAKEKPPKAWLHFSLVDRFVCVCVRLCPDSSTHLHFVSVSFFLLLSVSIASFDILLNNLCESLIFCSLPHVVYGGLICSFFVSAAPCVLFSVRKRIVKWNMWWLCLW